MPLFKSSTPKHDEYVDSHGRTRSTSPARKGSMFSRNRSVTPPPPQKTGLFGSSTNGSSLSRRRSSGSSANGSTHRRNGSMGGGLFNRDRNEDRSILTAREMVGSAEAAEKEADRALHQARLAVKEARNHVKTLEREAEEEYVFLISFVWL
ncbi:hypothetical protein BDV98DRAFT_565373 [Pterulicium gracile]|uniref:Uncharacterized protein n=1 Tax=Pterulicium gracile TaxID=1884261 RepID=A0A5C3QS20_9AGAR|nr:hypothetical protein BDV98DRAFT_565373 [Pterula gracilis]